MPRPGFVLEVDDKTPHLLTMSGAQLRLERFGIGTQVVYTADAEESSDPVGLIEAAVGAPTGGAPLAEQLSPGMKLTLVIIDQDAPLPRPHFDPRRALTERVLEIAARRGVDDVELVVANGLKQRWSTQQVSRALGDRVATSFLPDSLISSHDVTSDDLVSIGEVQGFPVLLNRRVAQSDVVVVIGVRADASEHDPLAVGLTDLATLDRLLGFDPAPGFAEGVSDLIRGAVEPFALFAVLGQPLLAWSLRFLATREWEWKLTDRLALAGSRQIIAALPRQGAQLVNGNPRADYAVIDVVGGGYASSLSDSLGVWQAANSVEVNGSADVLVTSVWGPAVDAVDSIGSPLDVAHHALVRRAGSHLAKPLAREGGALIAFHPLRNRFSNRRQSAAADFFAKVLTETTDAGEIAARFQARAMDDEWYLDLYRKNFADHPLRVYQLWYETARAAEQFSEIIWVGGDRRCAALLGHRSATTYADALEIASGTVGMHPSITMLRGPGLVLGDVR
ncbi:protein of unknown function [Tessaracoccus bendigoensis DSM 12906]|uniref:LarA-like N-terminal domain-containing protein n=1 Tax=Tessaracoccus bendigoensis DSM 12906 TaxID=1123357 RepID=A0A1M6CLK8_9ACTN|nr:lactate racemase domain-containing protein [Tessaracoccus bendigoensis]SHI61839.1 protein of unknown function [Tessaracoccus bendigoensis DSM 12906]